jgi:hypothetical protein
LKPSDGEGGRFESNGSVHCGGEAEVRRCEHATALYSLLSVDEER